MTTLGTPFGDVTIQVRLSWSELLVHANALGILSLWLGGHLTAWVLGRLHLYNPHLGPGAAGSRPGLATAGQWIGWLERFLLYVAVLSGLHFLIGALIAAKTIARFPEIQRPAPPGKEGEAAPSFAEYYLVGTLTSFSVGIFVPLAVSWVLAAVRR